MSRGSFRNRVLRLALGRPSFSENYGPFFSCDANSALINCTEEHRVYFSGDTGMTDAFKAIGEQFGPFDVALLEIRQWHPSWGQIHLGPEGALVAHKAPEPVAYSPSTGRPSSSACIPGSSRQRP